MKELPHSRSASSITAPRLPALDPAPLTQIQPSIGRGSSVWMQPYMKICTLPCWNDSVNRPAFTYKLKKHKILNQFPEGQRFGNCISFGRGCSTVQRADHFKAARWSMLTHAWPHRAAAARFTVFVQASSSCTQYRLHRYEWYNTLQNKLLCKPA